MLFHIFDIFRKTINIYDICQFKTKSFTCWSQCIFWNAFSSTEFFTRDNLTFWFVIYVHQKTLRFFKFEVFTFLIGNTRFSATFPWRNLYFLVSFQNGDYVFHTCCRFLNRVSIWCIQFKVVWRRRHIFFVIQRVRKCLLSIFIFDFFDACFLSFSIIIF